MGGNHVGLQARLMSQALRKMTGRSGRWNDSDLQNPACARRSASCSGSPETTTGGRAQVLLGRCSDVRRIETLPDRTEPAGNRTQVKVVKNKVALPFKQAESDIL